MIFKPKRWQYVLTGSCCMVLAVAAWLLWKPQPQSAQPEQITALSQRCQFAMLRDVCTVMKSSAPNVIVGRLFIAGIGEVDAQVFSQLRAAGQSMCQELAIECEKDWSGQACRIGKALYPDTAKPP